MGIIGHLNITSWRVTDQTPIPPSPARVNKPNQTPIRSARPEGSLAELERKIGQQALQIDFLKGGAAARRATADAAG